MKAFPPVPLPPEPPSTATQKVVEAQDTDWRALPGSMLAGLDQVPLLPARLATVALGLGGAGLGELAGVDAATEGPGLIGPAGVGAAVDGGVALVPPLPQAAARRRQATTAAASRVRDAPARGRMTLRLMLLPLSSLWHKETMKGRASPSIARAIFAGTRARPCPAAAPSSEVAAKAAGAEW